MVSNFPIERRVDTTSYLVLRMIWGYLGFFERSAAVAKSNLPPWEKVDDTLAERLRRRPAKPMGSPRVGSNPTGVVFRIM